MVEATEDSQLTWRKSVVAKLLPTLMERGVASTTMADIVAATGSNRAALYKHFGSQRGLLIEALRLYCGLARARFVGPLESRRGPPALREYVNALERYIQGPTGWTGCLAVNTASESPSDAELAQVIRNYSDGLTAAFERALNEAREDGHLRDGVNPTAAARMLGAMTHGVLGCARLYGSSAVAADALAQLRDVLEGWFLGAALGP